MAKKDKEKKEKPVKKKRFSFNFRKPPVVAVETKLVSAARVSHTLQIDYHGLSYAAKHLMLLIQHHVDAGLVKVPNSDPSWKVLVQINETLDLTEKKNRAKEICGVHHFGHELEEVAQRVTSFVFVHQRHNVVEL